MQVDELLKPFPIKEFHPFPRGMLGPGAHEMVGPEALKMGFKKTLLMTSGLRGTDIVHNMAESLKWHGLEVVVYDQVESNPKDYNVMDSVKLYQENECDSFISIGGGSTHDACKGARISIAHDGRNVNDFEGFNKSENPKNPPHIAISTTAGTGSETSWAYVITDTTTDPDNPHKYVAFDDACVATLAVDDPVLYFHCPVDYTAQCGFDVLAHASEPYVSRLNFETSLGNALHAIKLTAQNLREATWNGSGSQGPRRHDVRAIHRRAGVQLRRPGHHPLDLARDQRVLRHPPRSQQRDRAAPGVGVQHAGGLQAVRRHRPGDGGGHLRHDRRAGRRRRTGRRHPAAARRQHHREVHRRQARTATRRTGWAKARPSSTRTLR